MNTFEDRLIAWWSAWKWVAISCLLLALSAWVNLHQYGKARAAKAECYAGQVEAAKLAIEAERRRAEKADAEAGQIADKSKNDAAKAVSTAQGNTNERSTQIRAVVVHGDCRMPVGLPDLSAAAREANAAAGIDMPGRP